MSHPSRVRGLKYASDVGTSRRAWVAPLAGAWIEIRVLLCFKNVFVCRTPRGCVD